MVKRFFLLAAGAIALTACTSEEVVDDVATSQNAIQFENVVSKPTRAENNDDPSLTNANFRHFYVYGYYVENGQRVKIFDAVPVDRDPDTGACSYNGDIRYWIPGAQYYFYAYSCANEPFANATKGKIDFQLNGGDVFSNRLQISNYICNDTHQHDLVFAENEGLIGKESALNGAAQGNSKVTFHFKHLLSKVNAVFQSSFPETYSVVISDVSIENIMNTGDFEPAITTVTNGDGSSFIQENPTWKNVERNSELSTTLRLAIDDKNNKNVANSKKDDYGRTQDVTGGWVYTIPYDYSTNPTGESAPRPSDCVKIKFTMALKIGSSDPIMTREFEGTFYPNWKIGYSYTYSINLSGDQAKLDAIVFETSQDGALDTWDPDTSGNQVNIDFTSKLVETTPETPGE